MNERAVPAVSDGPATPLAEAMPRRAGCVGLRGSWPESDTVQTVPFASQVPLRIMSRSDCVRLPVR